MAIRVIAFVRSLLLLATLPIWIVSPIAAQDAFQSIRQAIESGEYDLARSRVAEIARTSATRHDMQRFVEALILKHRGELRAAAEALRNLIEDRPAYSRVRHELAHTLALLGDAERARHHFEHLALSTINADQRSAYEQFVTSLQASRPWTISGSFGFAPSTNINRGAADSDVWIGGLRFRPAETARSGMGVTYSLFGAYRFDMTGQSAFTIGSRVSGVEYGDTRFSTTTFENFTEVASRFGNVRIGIGPTMARTLQNRVGARTSWGAQGSIAYNAGDAGQLLLSAAWRRLDYDVANFANGHETTATLRHRFALNQRTIVTSELSGDFVTTRLSHNAYSAIRPGIELSRAFSKGIIGRTRLSYEFRQYNSDFPLTTHPRRDGILDVTVGATFNQMGAFGIAPYLEYRYVSHQSNIGIYSQTSHGLGLGVRTRY